MDINRWRQLMFQPPIKTKMKYYINSNIDNNQRYVDGNILASSILEQIKLCIDEQGGFGSNDEIEILVNVKYKKRKF